MPTDLATLTIAVDSRSVPSATGDLDRLAQSAARTEGSTDRLGAAYARSTASFVAAAQAMQAIQRAAEQAARAQNDMARASRAADIAAYGKALDDLRAKFNPLFAAGRQYRETLAEINQAAKVGAISETERAAAITRTKDAFAAHVTALKGGASASDNLTTSTKQAGMQIRLLGFQINDIATGLASGQAPFQILAQQGGQVYQALNGPGGVSAGLSNVGGYLRGLITPASAAGAALVGAAALAFTAWNRYDNLQKDVLRTTQGLGQIVGLSAGQFEEMARRAAAAGKLSVAQATDIANALARTGNVDASNIIRITGNFKDLSATFAEGDLSKGVQEVVRLFGNGAAGLDEMVKRLRLFSGEQLHVYENLIRQNRIQEAMSMVLQAFPGHGASFEQTTSRTAGLWERTKNWISETDLALGRMIDKAQIFTVSTPAIAQRAQQFGNLPSELPGIPSPSSPSTTPSAARPAVPAAPSFTNIDKDIEAAVRAQNKYRDATELSNMSAEEQIKLLRSARQDMAEGSINYERLTNVINNYDTVMTKGTEDQKRQLQETRDLSEIIDVARQAQKSLTDETGRRLTAEDLSAKRIQATNQSIQARTVAQKAAAAAGEVEEQNRGRLITSLQNEQEKRAASTQELLRWSEEQARTNRGIRDNIAVIDQQRNMIFASDEVRAVALSKLKAEQEMVERLGPRWRDYGAAVEFVRLRQEEATKTQQEQKLRAQFTEIKDAGVNAFTSIATAIASGTSAMDAMTAASKQLGSALISGGLKNAIEGLASGNFVQAGIGGAEAGVGALLTFFGAQSEKQKAARQKQLDDAKTQADAAAQKAQEINQSISTYLQRITAAAFAGQADTLQNRLAQFDAKANADRLDAMARGGAAVNLLETALGLERANIVADWGKKIADQEKAIADRRLSYEDRIFAAANDNNTFAGQVAAMERQFQREREAEIAQGGENLNTLLEAQNADRLKLYQDAADEQLRIQKAAFDDAKAFIEQAARSIKQYLDSLQTGNLSPLAPNARLAAAQSQFSTQLALAQGGDRDALSGITGYAGTLLDAAKTFYASSAGYQDVFNQITSQLGALPTQVSPEQFIVNAIDSQTDTLSDYLNSIDTNGDGLISRTEANGTALASIFSELDTNGDGQISKLEAIRGFTSATSGSAASTAGSTGSIDSYTVSTNTITGQIKGVNDTMSGVLSNSYNQLITANNQLSTQISSLANLAKIVFNTGTLVNFQNTTSHGSGAFRAGGLVDGIGTGTSDSNRIWASRGEYVVQAAAVRALGVGVMDQINSARLPALPMAAFAASNDNGALVAALVRVEARLASLEATTASGSGAVVEEIAGSRQDQRRVAADTRQILNRPRVAGTRAA